MIKWVFDSKRGTEAYVEPCQISKRGRFGEIVNG